MEENSPKVFLDQPQYDVHASHLPLLRCDVIICPCLHSSTPQHGWQVNAPLDGTTTICPNLALNLHATTDLALLVVSTISISIVSPTKGAYICIYPEETHLLCNISQFRGRAMVHNEQCGSRGKMEDDTS